MSGGAMSPRRTRKDARDPTSGAPLLATKLVPPRASRQRLARARLDDLLSDVAERLLTVVRAPGGFGKTTLALAWVESLHARGEHVAWLSVDADDDEPRRLLHHLIRSLHRACPTIGADTLRAVASGPLGGLQSSLVNEIADCGDDIFLFLDDYHCIAAPDAQEIVGFLLRHAPANLHVVILSRVEPPLGLASLRARGLLLEIDAARLRFTREETQEFLRLTTGTSLSAPDAGTVHGLTEGWPAALRITSLSVGAGGDPAALLRSLTGASRSIDSFLDELLARLPAATVAFMEQSAILDRLSAALCLAVTGRDDSAELLDLLARQQMLDPLGEEGTVYAYHQLLRDYLLRRLTRHPEADLPQLHRRAADWYESHDMLAESVKHWLASGDTQTALDRISQCAGALLQSGDVLTLLGWEQQLRHRLLQPPLELQLSVAWARTLSLSREEAAQCIVAAERSIASDTSAQAAAVRRECVALRAVIAGLADDPEQALALGRSYGPGPDDRPFARDAVHNALRFAYVMTARWPEFYAVPPVTGLTEDARAGRMTAIYEAFIRGVAEFTQGRATAAEQHYLRCLSLGAEVKGFSGAMTLAAGPYAELLYETGRLDAAAALVRGGVEQIVGGASVDTVLRGTVTAARLAARRGHHDAAQDLLDRAEAVGLTHEWPRLVAGVLFERLAQSLRARRTTFAAGLLKRLEQLGGPAASQGNRALPHARHYLVMAQLLVAADQNRASPSGREADAMFSAAVDCGAHLLAIRLGSALSCAHLAARNSGAALRVFRRVLDLAEPAGLVGSIADAGPEIPLLIAHAASDLAPGTAGDVRRAFLDRLRASATATPDDRAGEAPSGGGAVRSLLTPRECEILELIADGRSNKWIARHLSVGPETVKSHLKNVFTKLGVERRTQAVLRASELGLVRPRVRP